MGNVVDIVDPKSLKRDRPQEGRTPGALRERGAREEAHHAHSLRGGGPAHPVGDCNEHTVRYIAMARAAKIPSRVAIGLVSMRGAFCYHSWREVFVGDATSTVDGKTGV